MFFKSLLTAALAATMSASVALASGWEKGPALDTPVSHASAVTVGRDIYVAGGASPTGPSGDVSVLRKGRGEWEPMPGLPMPIQQFGMASDGTRTILVAGGYDAEGQALRKTWLLDVRSGAWSEGPDMPRARASFVLAHANGVYFAIGGAGGVADVDMYDPVSGRWTASVSQFASARAGAASAVLDGRIYVIGGQAGNDAVARVDVFDPTTGIWSAGPSLPSARQGSSAIVLDGAIHVAGGMTVSPRKSFDDHVALKGGGWKAQAKLPAPVHAAASATANGEWFLIGGSSGAGVYSTFTGTDTTDIFLP